MKTIAIVGVGLIGGSFALALRKAGFKGRIIGVSSQKTVRAAVDRGVIDEAAELEDAIPRADLIYLSHTISRILDTVEKLDPLLQEGALVTDAGSTKAEIVGKAKRHIRKAQFLGGHPMAGKETRGVEVAEPDLFAGSTYILTPEGPADLETEAAREFLDWLRRIGGVPVVLDAAEHDRVVAFTSHLPQLASTALAATLAKRPDLARHGIVAGPGLESATRLALSPFGIWQDILATNSGQVERALDDYISELREVRSQLAEARMEKEFDLATDFAARLRRGEGVA